MLCIITTTITLAIVVNADFILSPRSENTILIIVELSMLPLKLFVKSSDISISPNVSSVYFLESDKNVEMPKESACDVRMLSSSVSAL